ncbi:hypothetical protein ACQV2X_05610 [Facklamia sp. P12945]|uniref:hypothetical protein n=1 Tax=Facklamia sp. P12945 TaxID=3421950 RepID=UPI003D176366
MYKIVESILVPNGKTIVHLEYKEGSDSSFHTMELTGDYTNQDEREVIEMCKQILRDRLNPENAIKRLQEELIEAKHQIDEETKKAKAEMTKQVEDEKLEMQMIIGELTESLIGGMQ